MEGRHGVCWWVVARIRFHMNMAEMGMDTQCKVTCLTYICSMSLDQSTIFRVSNNSSHKHIIAYRTASLFHYIFSNQVSSPAHVILMYTYIYTYLFAGCKINCKSLVVASNYFHGNDLTSCHKCTPLMFCALTNRFDFPW